jgi:hypothetical protein
MIETTVFATDKEAIAACPQDLHIRAMKDRAIVWFLPYRRTSGVIEIPDKAKPQSAEAIVIDNNSSVPVGPGVMVCVSRHDGEYFEFQGHKLCRVKAGSMILVNTQFSPEKEAA